MSNFLSTQQPVVMNNNIIPQSFIKSFDRKRKLDETFLESNLDPSQDSAQFMAPSPRAIENQNLSYIRNVESKVSLIDIPPVQKKRRPRLKLGIRNDARSKLCLATLFLLEWQKTKNAKLNSN